MFNVVKWYRAYSEASFQTKVFIWVTFLFSIVLLFGTIHPYARLDFARSY